MELDILVNSNINAEIALRNLRSTFGHATATDKTYLESRLYKVEISDDFTNSPLSVLQSCFADREVRSNELVPRILYVG